MNIYGRVKQDHLDWSISSEWTGLTKVSDHKAITIIIVINVVILVPMLTLTIWQNGETLKA